MNPYRFALIIVFLSVGCFSAWIFDESHLLQGITDVSTARELLNREHLQMAIAGLVGGGLAILIVDESKKRIIRKKSNSDDGAS